MRKKLNCILLVDDDAATNFLHRKIIEKMEITEKIDIVQNGQEALDYLQNIGKYTDTRHDFPQPQVIFLDINMPVMNGWEFLEEYNKLHVNQQAEIVIMMLTTSSNPDDQKKAESFGMVSEFRHKPLTIQMLNEIMEKHFPEYL